MRVVQSYQKILQALLSLRCGLSGVQQIPAGAMRIQIPIHPPLHLYQPVVLRLQLPNLGFEPWVTQTIGTGTQFHQLFVKPNSKPPDPFDRYPEAVPQRVLRRFEKDPK